MRLICDSLCLRSRRLRRTTPTDFAAAAAEPLPAHVRCWLQASPGVPVVYVALGTLAVLPPALIAALHEGMAASRRFRFLWVFPASQAGLLPQGSRAAADTQAWLAAHGSDTRGSDDCRAEAAPPPPAAGSVLLSDWLPQVAALSHASVAAFLTHGGMNGVAEATFAHTPLLCMPFFSDQPDNCVHAEVGGRGEGTQRRLSYALLPPRRTWATP